MALITKIRNNSWLLIVVIGLALAAFLMMDMFSGGPQGRQSSDFVLGTVNGEEIDYMAFQKSEQILYSGGSDNVYGNRNSLWNYYVERALSNQYAEELGLGVSDDEMMDLQFGANLSPVIQQRFTNPNTRQIDRERLNAWKSQLQNNSVEPDQRAFWKEQMEEVRVDRLQSKINSMVGKSLYVPNWMAEQRNEEQTASASVTYVQIPYSQIDDSEVQVTDEDIMNYMKAHAAQYEQDQPTRTASYTVFNILPTKEDTMAIIARLEALRTQWSERLDTDSTFIMNKRGSYPNAYQKADQLSEVLRDKAFELNVGDLYGPFLDQGSYRVVRILDKMVIPDSVEARHILREVKTQEQVASAHALVDSLIDVISSGATTFEEAAQAFGQDATASQGGDLGYSAPGRMVPQFNDAIFYQAKGDELMKVYTQFGIHIVQVTNRKFDTKEEGVRVASIAEPIKPSVETQEAEYDRVYDLLSQNVGVEALTKAVSAMGGQMMTSGPLQQNDYAFPELRTATSARELIRWLYTPGVKQGETSPEVYVYKDPQLFYNAKLVVAGLKEINDGDYPSVASVRSQLLPLVANEKKAELIKKRISGGDLAAIAANFGTTIQEADGVSLLSRGQAGISGENEVLGVALSQAENTTSGPIAGNGGVYIVRTNSKTPATPAADLASSKRLFGSMAQQQVRYQLWRSLREASDIEDKRSSWF